MRLEFEKKVEDQLAYLSNYPRMFTDYSMAMVWDNMMFSGFVFEWANRRFVSNRFNACWVVMLYTGRWTQVRVEPISNVPWIYVKILMPIIAMYTGNLSLA